MCITYVAYAGVGALKNSRNYMAIVGTAEQSKILKKEMAQLEADDADETNKEVPSEQ